jgi:hypothetical protein
MRHADEVGRDAEDSRIEGIPVQRVVGDAAGSGRVGAEAVDFGVGAPQAGFEHEGVFDVQITTPEARVGVVDEPLEDLHALLLRPQHRNTGETRVPDLLRTSQRLAAQARVAPSVSIGVPHPRPLLGRPLAAGHPAPLVEPGGAEVAGNVEREGAPIDEDPQRCGHRTRRFDGDERVRALQIDVDGELRVAAK